MNSFKDLFTPLDKKYCNYFYYMSVITYCFFILMILMLAWCLVFHSKKVEQSFILILYWRAGFHPEEGEQDFFIEKQSRVHPKEAGQGLVD